MSLPIIALVGRPNVGKSTLFNRLTRSRDALVANFPGLTRDRRYGIGRLGVGGYVVIDTGGLSGEPGELGVLVERQVLQAVKEADATVLITDAKAGFSVVDEEIGARLRRLGSRVVVAVNKTERIDADSACAEFQALGLGNPVAISAAHGRGVDSLVEQFLALAQERGGVDVPGTKGIPGAPSDTIVLAVVGKPNVGKSTLINRLLGEERVLASDLPGTTRDSISIPFEREGTRYTLVDTAGVRRRSRVHEIAEKFSIVKTLQSVEAANVVILMLDAREGITEQDASLLGYVAERGRALIIAVNKWDRLSQEQRRAVQEGLSRRLGFVDYADVRYVSALHGTGIVEVLRSANLAFEAANRELATADLTRVLQEAVGAHQPPLVGGRRIKLRYAHQGGRNPPIIVIHGSRTDKVPQSYRRYLMSRYREVFGLRGTPVRVEFRTAANPYVSSASGLRKRGRG